MHGKCIFKSVYNEGFSNEKKKLYNDFLINISIYMYKKINKVILMNYNDAGNKWPHYKIYELVLSSSMEVSERESHRDL